MADTKVATKQSFTSFITSDAVKQNILSVLNDKAKVDQFIPTVINAVTMNPTLARCEAKTIINAALQGYQLKLNPQLQQFYIVPYGDIATFQVGWKGLVQLALRSGEYKYLNVGEVRQGEDIINNRLTGQMIVTWLPEEEREKAPVVGYFAYFQLLNGLEKSIFWHASRMKTHALTYSQSYKSDVRNGGNNSYWSKDFDGMAFKTMLKQLISKWGPMSIELQQAIVNDMSEINDDGKPSYVDNQPTVATVQTEAKELTATKPLMVDETTGEVAPKDPFDEAPTKLV